MRFFAGPDARPQLGAPAAGAIALVVVQFVSGCGSSRAPAAGPFVNTPVDAAPDLVADDTDDAGAVPDPTDDAGGAVAPDAAHDLAEETRPPPVPAGDYETTAVQCTPAAANFLDAVAPETWVTISIEAASGMQGLVNALAQAAAIWEQPVRVRLGAGSYAATSDEQPVVSLRGPARRPAAPLVIEAVDRRPDATTLTQGLAFIGGSYFALDGLTFGPAAVGAFHGSDFCQPGSCYHEPPRPLQAPAAITIAGTALAPETAGENSGRIDFAVYGRYAPAHHILIRRVTIQNLFGDDEPSGVGAAAASADGIALSHAADVWIVDSRIRQIARHAIDAVAVHGACVRGNFIAEVGSGLPLGARGGSIDVTFDGNILYDVRRLELGGVYSDAVAHWSVEPPGSALHYAYEARRLVARNNFVVDARQGGLGFAGCHECAAVGNSIVFRAGFDLASGGGDAVREADSAINRWDASSSCLGAEGQLVDPCWGVGAHPAELVPAPAELGGLDEGRSRVLPNGANVLANNLFVSADGFWGPDFNPYRAELAASTGLREVDHNYWWNGGAPLDDPGDDTWLKEGPHSVLASSIPAASVGLTVAFLFDPASAAAPGLIEAALRPKATSALAGKGSAGVLGFAAHDAAGRVRPLPPAIGALEP
jgi:hypothetical protein